MKRFLLLAIICLCGIILMPGNRISGNCPGGTGGGGSPIPGGGPGIAAPPSSGASAQRPFLGVGLQPRIQSLQSLNNVAELWEVWWTRNRDKYMSFRQPIEWTSVVDLGGTKSYSISPFYEKLIGVLAEAVYDKDIDIAFRAAISLGKVQDSMNPTTASPQAVEILKKAHKTEKRDFIRNNILLGLGLTGDASVAPVIKEVLRNNEIPPLRRSFAALALGYISTDPDSATALKEILSAAKEDREVKATACIAIGNLKDESAAPILGKILAGAGGKKEQAMIRSYAALGLGRIGNNQALKELAKITSDNERDNDVLSAVILALGMTELPEARENLMEFLGGKNPELKGLACIALAQIRDSQAYENITEALRKNKSQDADGLMLIALGLTGNEKAKPDLRKILADNKKNRSLLRSASAIGLGLLNDTEAISVIADILKDNKNQNDTILAPYLILALNMISGDNKNGPGKQAAVILQKMWDKADKNLVMNSYTNLALALMNLTSRGLMIKELVKHANSKEPAVRAYAIHTLGLIGTRDTAQVFIEAASDTNSEVSKAAIVGIGFLMDKNRINPIDKVTADSIDLQMRIMDHILPLPTW